ncbi:MAG: cytochrome P450 [Acidimicrobiia bacterium]|nr:cytochrome P450 [Acidimicrobiia bacterium]
MTSDTGTERPTADLLDPQFYLHDLHPATTWMRAHEPVYRDEANGLWAVTRHHDVHDVEARDEVFVSGRGYRSHWSPDETNMIALDDPAHATQRRLVSRRFTPRAVRDHEDWVRAAVREMLDAVVESGHMEVINDLAGQLPTRLTARLLGWDESRWPEIKSWAERLMAYDAIIEDADAANDMLAAIMEFGGELPAMLEERRGCPMGDLLSVWATAELDGVPMDPMRIMHETGLFISGGAETTRTVISRGLRAFCDHNDQWELLAREPATIPGAVEEMIRWVTPLNNFFRTAVVDSHIGDQPVAAGDRVILLYPSANRDEAVFDEPFRFDVERSPNPHVAFGFGTHFCLGASLARMVLTVLLEEMTSTITNLRVDDEVEDIPNIFACMVASLGLGFDRR